MKVNSRSLSVRNKNSISQLASSLSKDLKLTRYRINTDRRTLMNSNTVTSDDRRNSFRRPSNYTPSHSPHKAFYTIRDKLTESEDSTTRLRPLKIAINHEGDVHLGPNTDREEWLKQLHNYLQNSSRMNEYFKEEYYSIVSRLMQPSNFSIQKMKDDIHQEKEKKRRFSNNGISVEKMKADFQQMSDCLKKTPSLFRTQFKLRVRNT